MTSRRKVRSLLSLEDQRLWQHVSGQIKPLSGRDRLRSHAAELLQQQAPDAAQDQPPVPLKRRAAVAAAGHPEPASPLPRRSEEHTSELQSLMSISYAGFWLQ